MATLCFQVPKLHDNSLFDWMDVESRCTDLDSLGALCGKYTTHSNEMYESIFHLLDSGCALGTPLVPPTVSRPPATPSLEAVAVPCPTPSLQPEEQRAVSPTVTGPIRTLASLLAGTCNTACAGPSNNPPAVFASRGSSSNRGVGVGDGDGGGSSNIEASEGRRQPTYMQPTAVSRAKASGRGAGSGNAMRGREPSRLAKSVGQSQHVRTGTSGKRRWL